MMAFVVATPITLSAVAPKRIRLECAVSFGSFTNLGHDEMVRFLELMQYCRLLSGGILTNMM